MINKFSKLNRKAQKITSVQAFLVSLLLILNGFNVVDNYLWIGVLNTLFGLCVLIFSINFLRGKINPLYKSISLFLEGMGLLLASYILYDQGSNYLHYAIILASLLCFFGSYIMYRKIKKHRNEPVPLNDQ